MKHISKFFETKEAKRVFPNYKFDEEFLKQKQEDEEKRDKKFKELMLLNEVAMTIKKQGANYKKLENFVEWLKRVAKAEVDATYVIETLKELEKQYNNNECEWYELSGFETKSGNPETYSYSVEYVENEDGDIKIIVEF